MGLRSFATKPGARSTALAVAFLVAVPLALFWPALFLGRMIYGYDLLAVFAPFSAAVQRSLACHEWPLWMPDLLGGMPGVAACNLPFAYPTDLLGQLWGWPLPLLNAVNAALHVALAGLGMFLFLRRLDRSRSAALLGAFAFAVSGSQVSQLFGGWVDFVQATSMVPWAFWAAHRGAREGRGSAWALCGAALGLQVLALGAQLFTYTLAAVAAFALAQAPPRPGRGGRLSAWAPVLKGLVLALMVAALIAAPQLWLTLQYLPLSARQLGGWDWYFKGSLTFYEGLTWWVPGYFGWQAPLYHGDRGLGFVSEYFGLLPWVLASAAAWAGWRDARVRWMLGLALAALFLAQRVWTPHYQLLAHLPVLAGFRGWSRILFLLTFAVCALAAFGWDALRAGERIAAARRGAAACVALLLLAAAGAWWAAPQRALADAGALAASASAPPALREPGRMAEALLGLARGSATATLGLLLLLAALLWLQSRRRGAVWVLALALAFHALDQAQVTTRFIRCIDPAVANPALHFNGPPPPPPGVEPWRVLDAQSYDSNDAMALGYESLGGRESMPMRGPQRIREALARRGNAWFDLMNVRYVLQRGGADPDAVTVRENPHAYPRAWLVGRSVEADDAEAYRLLADPAFDPRSRAALAQGPGLAGGAPQGGVTWLSRSPQGEAMEAATDRDAVLVLSNAWHPSWRCRVDGRAQPVLEADGGLQAVALKAGRHQVELWFDAGLFRWALAAAGLGWLLVLGWVFIN